MHREFQADEVWEDGCGAGLRPDRRWSFALDYLGEVLEDQIRACISEREQSACKWLWLGGRQVG